MFPTFLILLPRFPGQLVTCATQQPCLQVSQGECTATGQRRLCLSLQTSLAASCSGITLDAICNLNSRKYFIVTQLQENRCLQ